MPQPSTQGTADRFLLIAKIDGAPRKYQRRQPRITDGAARRGSRIERQDRIPVEMVGHIPRHMQYPSCPDEAIVAHTQVRQRSHENWKDEFPRTEATGEVRCPCPCNHQSAQLASQRFLEQRENGNKDARKDEGQDSLDQGQFRGDVHGMSFECQEFVGSRRMHSK